MDMLHTKYHSSTPSSRRILKLSFFVTMLSLRIFILHRLRNKFLQLILISLDSASWELHQYSRRMCGPMKNPKVETRSLDSNLGPHDCKADALPHDHGHHTMLKLVTPGVGPVLTLGASYEQTWYRPTRRCYKPNLVEIH